MWRSELVLLLLLSIAVASIGVVCFDFLVPQAVQEGKSPWITLALVVGGLAATGCWLWLARMTNRESSKQLLKKRY